MADASRFPSLAPPFAIVGASAGWLSAGLLANPLVLSDERLPMQPAATFVGMVMGALSGFLLRRACIEKRCSYALDPPDPSTRAWADVWGVHAAVILAAGAATGAIVGTTCEHLGDPLVATGIASLCALAFLPVCLAVLAAGRRAQRARLGSIVAHGDRRAVWGILATTLGVTTLEALPDWPASAAVRGPMPLPALALVSLAVLVVLAILNADRHASKQAEDAITAVVPDQGANADDGVTPRIDLGLGDEVGACVARSASPYRGRDATVALVMGTPELVRAALRRCVSRGRIGLAVLGAVMCAHLAAHTCLGEHAYEALRAARYGSSRPSSPSLREVRSFSRASPAGEPGPRSRDSQRLRCQGFVSEPRTGR